MQILKLNPLENFIVISDVHLRDPNDNLTNLFISTLNSLSNTEAIFLLGDIFDFVAVKSNFFFKLWKNVFQALQNLKEKGVQVYFIEGNHDFGFEHFKSPFLNNCFNAYGDFIIEFQHPQLGLIHLRHGDDIICKPSYLKFRSFVKNKYFQHMISWLVCGRLMHFIFSRYAKISRKKDAYRTLSETFLNSCLNLTINKYSNINVLIIGHIHILRDFMIDNRVRFLVGPDWMSQPSYLIYNSNMGFERKFIH
ncbi:MAG: metallophosphoesterase [Bdellovibrionota bacterium]